MVKEQINNFMREFNRLSNKYMNIDIMTDDGCPLNLWADGKLIGTLIYDNKNNKYKLE